jgi:acylphosphatase
MNECRKFRVEGRVQGVWFRESTRQEAQRLDITGHAINCADGSVEVLACGDREALDRLARWLHRGPQMAEVKSVAASGFEGDCPTSFSTG